MVHDGECGIPFFFVPADLFKNIVENEKKVLISICSLDRRKIVGFLLHGQAEGDDEVHRVGRVNDKNFISER